MQFVPTIGLEVHVQLNTKSKLFSTAPTSFGAQPNHNTSSVCLGLPGALPTLNNLAVEKAVLAGLAINSKIHSVSYFDRKNYFYPDLPKGYQITQVYHPYCTNGEIYIDVNGKQKRIGVNRIHIEEDAGKLIHSENPSIKESYIDLNRAGTPLIEIVSEPEIDSADEAVAYLNHLRNIMLYIDVSDCNMEEGSFRVDANVSIASPNAEKLGTRVEIKNLNSFKAVKAAIQYEIERQTSVILSEDKVVQETRLWNAKDGITASMRGKEQAHDYLYFPDPDLVPLILSEDEINRIKSYLPELSAEKKVRFVKEYNIPEYDADVLTRDRFVADYYEAAVLAGGPPKKIANWIMVEMLAVTSERDCTLSDLFPAHYLSELVEQIESGVISGKIGKTVFSAMIEENKTAKEIIASKSLSQISDPDKILKIVKDIMDKNPDSVESFRAGKDRALKYLVGQVMKDSQGKANPEMVTKILLENLKN